MTFCFVCDKIEWGMQRMLNTIFRIWQQEEEFRTLYKEQECLCLPHYTQLMTLGKKAVSKKNYKFFAQDTAVLANQYLQRLTDDVNKFCSMYDYRNAGGDWGTSKDAVERAVWFLTSHYPGGNKS